MRRAVHLSVIEARNQRKRTRLIGEKITRLAAAQLITEEKLQGLINAWRSGGNGSR